MNDFVHLNDIMLVGFHILFILLYDNLMRLS